MQSSCLSYVCVCISLKQIPCYFTEWILAMEKPNSVYNAFFLRGNFPETLINCKMFVPVASLSVVLCPSLLCFGVEDCSGILRTQIT